MTAVAGEAVRPFWRGEVVDALFTYSQWLSWEVNCRPHDAGWRA